jgi:hypothetical protein
MTPRNAILRRKLQAAQECLHTTLVTKPEDFTETSATGPYHQYNWIQWCFCSAWCFWVLKRRKALPEINRMLQTNHLSLSYNGAKKDRPRAKFIIIMCYQRGGTERGDVTCHVTRDRTLLIGINSKASEFPARAGRGGATKWFKLQAFITFWPTAWH